MKFFLVGIVMMSSFYIAAQTKVQYQIVLLRSSGKVPMYALIVKEIDPAKVDFKGCCKYVVRDFAKTHSVFALTIYDNKEAQSLKQLTMNGQRPLTKVEQNKVNSHLVCIYSKGLDETVDNELGYYPDSYGTLMHKYHSREIFKL